MLFSSFFCLLYIPYRLAKTKLIINNNEYIILFFTIFSEIIFIIDLIFGFFRWYYNKEFKLVNNIHMITSHYLSSNFITDLIMAIPFFSILRFIVNKENNGFNNELYNENHFMLKILVCFKAFKIFKINKIKYNQIFHFLNKKFTKNYYLERLYQIINFIIIICSMFNLIICYHIYIAELSYPNWIVSFKLQDKSFIQIYISSFYFIIATMTSVGYGDIVCISSAERYFQIILLSIGLVAYSYIISAVGDYVKNKSRALDNYNRDMAKLEEIRIAYPNMPFKLYNKIQQHIQRMLTQNKKYEYNLLVNSLPYYLQNSILFQIHKNEINKFSFFKDCDNSDFILKVLTHFIPIFSKKNIVLVGEGEFFENIFFIKDGRLSLEAIIDLDNIEMSIEKYLKYRFEEIEQIEDLNDKENSFQKSSTEDNSQIKGKKGKIKHKKLIGIINKQFENVDEASFANDSSIDQEIGRYDFNTDIKDIYKGNIEYIRILDLLKNTHFGEILMSLNIPNPLSLRVKSKRVELYVLRKKDAFNIRKDHQNIWQRLNRKSIYNIKSLKALTLDIITRYCESIGIIIKNNEIVKSNLRKSPSKYVSNKTNNFLNKKKANLNSVFDLGKCKTKRTSLPLLSPLTKTFKLKEDKEFNKKQKTLKQRNKMKGKNSVHLINNIDLNINEENNNDNLNKKEIKNKRNSVSFNKGKKEKKLNQSSESLSSSSFLSDNKINEMTNQKLENHPNNIINKHKKQTPQNNMNNYFKYITKESNINFQIMPCYKNINDIAKGKYINNNNFQELIQKIIKYCMKINILEKKYSDKFNHIKRKILKNKFDTDLIKLPEKKLILEKPSIVSEKDENSIFKKIQGINTKSNIENKDSLNNANKIQVNNLQFNSFNISKNKEILSDSNNINASNEKLNEDILKYENIPIQTFRKIEKKDNTSKNNQEIKQEKPKANLYTNNIIKNESGNNIHDVHEVNLNYVNNFCYIY